MRPTNRPIQACPSACARLTAQIKPAHLHAPDQPAATEANDQPTFPGSRIEELHEGAEHPQDAITVQSYGWEPLTVPTILYGSDRH